MNDFAVRADPEGVLWLEGEFDLAAIDAFQAAVDAVLDAQRELVLDLSKLTFLDSTGIRAFLVVAGLVGGGLILRRPTQAVRRVLDLVGIDGQLGISIQE
ncbi:MAG: STAS domain-containing protein [Actinomycetota bacterium]